jgi:hypothetical protein
MVFTAAVVGPFAGSIESILGASKLKRTMPPDVPTSPFMRIDV